MDGGVIEQNLGDGKEKTKAENPVKKGEEASKKDPGASPQKPDLDKHDFFQGTDSDEEISSGEEHSSDSSNSSNSGDSGTRSEDQNGSVSGDLDSNLDRNRSGE